MNVWIINLKDKRENATPGASKRKFDKCLAQGIIAIGWTYGDLANDKNYRYALSRMNEMQCGDLVWTKDPSCRQRYICEIIDGQTNKAAANNNDDIHLYRKCIFHAVSDSQISNESIDFKSLISRKTVRRVCKQDIIKATIALEANI